MSIPNALVDLPLPWPVSTISSGLSRGLRRLGSALPRSSGACGTSLLLRPPARTGGEAGAGVPRGRGGGPEPHRPLLAVEDHDARRRLGEPLRGLHGVVALRRPAVGDD